MSAPLPRDKVLHVIVGAAIVYACMLIGGVTAIALGYDAVTISQIGLLAGAFVVAPLAAWGKELYDKDRPENHTFDPADANHTIVGALAAALAGYSALNLYLML